jgi:P-type Mg2+ transporter
LQKDLQVIIDAILEGRKIYVNNTKYITATLSSNFGNFYAVAIASLLVSYLPMLPIQILLVNLLSDFPMIAIAGDNVDEEVLSSPHRQSLSAITAKATALGMVSTVFDFIYFAIFQMISISTLQTGWFVTSILTELLFLFSVRTNKPFFQAVTPAKTILVLTSLAFITTIIIPYLPIGERLFKFVPLTSWQMGIIIGIVFSNFLISEVVKLTIVKRINITS